MTTHAQRITFSTTVAAPAARLGLLQKLRALFPTAPYPPRRPDYFERAAMAREMYRL